MEYVILVSLWIYIFILLFKYQFQHKVNKDLTYYRESKFLEHSPIFWYYLLNKRLNNNTIIATILYYLIKGYISMEVISNNASKDYEFKIVKDLNSIPEEDSICLKVFFNTELEINTIKKLSDFNKMMLCEKTFGHIKDVYKSIINVIKEKLLNENKIKQISRRLNIINIILCVVVVILANLFRSTSSAILDIYVMLVGISIFITFLKRNSWLAAILYGIICPMIILYNTDYHYFISNLIIQLSCIFLIYVDDLLFKRINSDNLESKASGLKKYITDFATFEDKPLEQIALWEEFYVYAVVFGVKKI